MQNFTPWSALLGGAMIGLAASLLLLMQGRVAGISGIINGLFDKAQPGRNWRAAFLVGLIAGAVAVIQLNGLPYTLREDFPLPLLIGAGLLVGFGTRLGSGCTSGHGVCGIARLSSRSIVATLLFMLAGVLAVTFLTRPLGGF